VSAADWPSQITVLPVTPTVTVLITDTVAFTEVDETQPNELVPAIAYVLVMAGITVLVLLEYEYVLAPLGASVNTLPGQMVPLGTVMVGSGFTVIWIVCDPTQLLALVPVTV
jgi:hypothetical protein